MEEVGNSTGYSALGRSMDNTEDCGEGDVMGPWRKLVTALVTVPWAGQWTTQRIAVKEMLLVVVACAIRGPYWQHLQVLVRSNNMAVVHG